MRGIVVIVSTVALAVTTSAGAEAPDQNGDIAFVSDRRGADNLYVARPSGLRELTHSLAAAADLHVSPDRRLVAYARKEHGEKTELWVATTSGKNPRRIVSGQSLVSNFEPAWSPDGRRLVFIRQDHPGTPIASAFVVEVDGGGLRRLTPAGRDVGEPAWSPDGSWIAVWTALCGIAVVRPDGSHFRKLPIRGQMCATDPAWSPDGRRIAFAGGNSLYVVRSDGRGVRRIFRRRKTELSDPEWSPDGRHIAFSLAHERVSGIFAVRPSGSGLRPIPGARNGESPSWVSTDAVLFVRRGGLWRSGLAARRAVRVAPYRPALDPAWSPDGRALAFTAPGPRGDPNLYELPARGGAWRTILRSWRKDSRPSWSPDGTKLAFTRGDLFVWTVGRNGRGQKHVTEGIDPDWSPDGRRLAYAVLALHIVNVDGSGKRRLTPRGAQPPRVDADWSPDGSRIAFTRTSADYKSAHVYVVNQDGKGLRPLVRNASQPSWSPDGRLLAFVRDSDIWTHRVSDGRQSMLVGGPHREHSPAWGRATP